MATSCRGTPLPIARLLRQEANFGCAQCGCPILDNAHIIPFSKTHEFIPEDMVSLCPKCHREADKGGWSETYLRTIKKNPYNKAHVTYSFHSFIERDRLVVNIGTNRFINTPGVLSVDKFGLIAIRKAKENFMSLDVYFFDKSNILIGAVLDNRWIVDRRLVWDLKYTPQHLIIQNKPKTISLDIEIVNGEVYLSGDLYYLGHLVKITKDEVRTGTNSISGNIFVNSGGINITLPNQPGREYLSLG